MNKPLAKMEQPHMSVTLGANGLINVDVTTPTLERIAHLTDTLRGFYVESYDGPGSESLHVLEMREELGELLAPNASAYERERAFFKAMGWRFP